MTLTDWLTAIGTLITAAATVGLVLGAIGAWKTAKATLEQMEKDSKAEARPYLNARLETSIGSTHATDLVIRNTGRTAARDVTTSINYWPDRSDAVTEALKKLMETPQTIPPNTSIRSYWNLDTTGESSDGNLGIQIPTVMHLYYRGDDPDEWFEDSYPLDTTSLGLTPLGWSGSKSSRQGALANRLNEVVRAISELRRNQ